MVSEHSEPRKLCSIIHLATYHSRNLPTDSAEEAIYFIANRTDRPQEIQARFRVNGKEAEFWHADTGVIEPADYAIADGRTIVPLHLDQRESVFVVFRRAAASPSRANPQMTTATLATFNGPWDVTFPPNLGAPQKIRLADLESWTANSDEGIKYFSGTATYAKTFRAAKVWREPAARIMLDLGTVRDIAEISINGQPAAALWKPPYRAEITGFLKTGENRLEIKITNQWTNRQIGDQSLDPGNRILAPSPARPGRYGPPPTLTDSGLLGPVKLISRMRSTAAN